MEQDGKSIFVSALRDTGNTLRDAVTGKPVVVLEADRGAELLGRQLPRKLLRDAPAAAEYLHGQCPELHPRLISYRAVGTESGLLLAVPCTAKLGKKRAEVLTAFSPGPISDGGGYEALIGGTVF